jgi:hypothetical protein
VARSLVQTPCALRAVISSMRCCRSVAMASATLPISARAFSNCSCNDSHFFAQSAEPEPETFPPFALLSLFSSPCYSCPHSPSCSYVVLFSWPLSWDGTRPAWDAVKAVLIAVMDITFALARTISLSVLLNPLCPLLSILF